MKKSARKKTRKLRRAVLPVEHVTQETVQPNDSLPVVEIIQEKRKISRLQLIIGVLVILLISAVAVAAFLYQQTRVPKTPQDQAQSIVAHVGRLIALPQNETPTIATVSDVNKLKSEPFFANAKNGDKVLIYQNAKKAFLYDPNADKIVNVGPLNVQSPTPTVQISTNPSISPTKEPHVTVVLYNGTSITGLASTVEGQLKTTASNVQVVTKSNAAKNDYTKTLVIDLNGNNALTAQSLATTLHGSVGKLPEGEQAPSNADILVILGK